MCNWESGRLLWLWLDGVRRGWQQQPEVAKGPKPAPPPHRPQQQKQMANVTAANTALLAAAEGCWRLSEHGSSTGTCCCSIGPVTELRCTHRQRRCRPAKDTPVVELARQRQQSVTPSHLVGMAAAASASSSAIRSSAAEGSVLSALCRKSSQPASRLMAGGKAEREGEGNAPKQTRHEPGTCKKFLWFPEAARRWRAAVSDTRCVESGEAGACLGVCTSERSRGGPPQTAISGQQHSQQEGNAQPVLQDQSLLPEEEGGGG